MIPRRSRTQIESFQHLSRGQVAATMAAVVLAVLLSALDQTIVGTALPRIVSELGGFSRYTWVATSYLLASTAVVPIVGKLTDLYGRKPFYLGGVALFLVASALCGTSQTMDQLIVFRGLQGLGAGVMLANAFVVIGDLFPPAERGKYQGIVSSAFGLASIIGPATGGYITDNLSWRWVFYVNIPLGLVVLVVLGLAFPNVRPARHRRPLDVPGVVLLLLAVVPILLALSLGGHDLAWSSPQIVGLLGLGLAAGLAFVWVERRAEEPILPLGLFRDRIVAAALAAAFLMSFALFGAIIFVPLLLQGGLGASATVSGSILTPMMLSMVAGSILSGQLLSRSGGRYRRQALVGVTLATLGTYLLTTVTLASSPAEVIRDLVLVGLGLGTLMPILTIAVQNAVPYEQMGVATASTQFFRSIGGTLGLAVLGSVMTHRFSAALGQALPAPMRQALTPERLAELGSNANALADPRSREQLEAGFAALGSQGGTMFQQLMEAMRLALAAGLHDVFLVATAAMIASCVALLFLREIPLRQSHATARSLAGTPLGPAVPEGHLPEP